MSKFAIESKDLTVRIGETPALEDISFSLPEGDFLSIVGPNGAGKSTLLRTLMGLHRPSKGSLRIFGRKPGRIEPDWISYVPQIKTLDKRFPALSIELVATGLNRRWPSLLGRKARDKARDALERLGAEHLANRSIDELSGGELQRVYLARTLIARPRMIILDEPTTGIDTVGEEDMFEQIERYQKENGATIIMVTHDWNAVYHRHSCVLLLNRRQIGFGQPEEALKDENMRRAFGHVGHDHPMLFGTKDA